MENCASIKDGVSNLLFQLWRAASISDDNVASADAGDGGGGYGCCRDCGHSGGRDPDHSRRHCQCAFTDGVNRVFSHVGFLS
ncbi:Hypothetical predicted protein [Octopus vulgaris]|uniref:Uncharacterized protein n=1 Tax=Octopus vulgaris TaxID=6645 RepID=A0AA36EYE9_OCTVU|nr:Hypothetical predicted protein [Octopus vulgaris]